MSTVATISEKGQLAIPRPIRKALHLEPGDRVSLELEGQRLVLRKKRVGKARLVSGRFGRKVLVAPPGSLPMTTDTVNAILAGPDTLQESMGQGHCRKPKLIS
ncbi:MAG: AbrB/MazE/SpoVT family DNA-binding domain-containing protein [Verrucomicrobiota bacterium]